MSSRTTSAALWFAAWAQLAAPAVFASQPGDTEQYEQQFEQWALEQSGLERDPAPDGKTIERIEIVRQDIFGPDEPWPDFLNYAHVTTRDHVIRREVLLQPGQLWDAELVEESMRNLRAFYILGAVRAVPCRSQISKKVILLVATRDVWSIRLNQSFLQVGQMLHYYLATPTEQNFTGLNRKLSLHIRVQEYDFGAGKLRDSLTLGQLYFDPRVFGSRVALVETFRVILSGEVPCGGKIAADGRPWCPATKSGSPEGTYAQLHLERPLYSLDARWAFETLATVNMQKVRSYRFNSGDSAPPLGETSGLSIRADTYSDTIAVPRVYNARNLSLLAKVTRSAGHRTKHQLTGGVAAYSNRYSYPDNLRLSDEVLQWHSQLFLPRSEDAAYLFARYRMLQPRFVKLYNLQAFTFGEDITLGPDAWIETRLGSAADDLQLAFVTLNAGVRYRWYGFDDLLTLHLAASTRLQPGLRELPTVDPSYPGDFYEGQLIAEATNASPQLWLGRLFVRGRMILRKYMIDGQEWEPVPLNAVNSRKVYLGADSGLRGYVSGRYEGDNLLQGNIEFRTLPVDIFSLQTGLLFFYDAGGVFGGTDPQDPEQQLPFVYKHSVGMGIRCHFPQFDKENMRIDFGIPLTSDRGAVGTWFSLSFGQVI